MIYYERGEKVARGKKIDSFDEMLIIDFTEDSVRNSRVFDDRSIFLSVRLR